VEDVILSGEIFQGGSTHAQLISIIFIFSSFLFPNVLLQYTTIGIIPPILTFLIPLFLVYLISCILIKETCKK